MAEVASALPAGWTQETYTRYFLLYHGVRRGYVEPTERGWYWWVYNHSPYDSGYKTTEAEARAAVLAAAGRPA